MDRKSVWIVIGAAALVALGFGMSRLVAQFQPAPNPGQGRYQAVSNTSEGIIILDTVTGDLYRARGEDVRPYWQRPRGDDYRGGDPRFDPRYDRSDFRRYDYTTRDSTKKDGYGRTAAKDKT
jgi:hypothetical protein